VSRPGGSARPHAAPTATSSPASDSVDTADAATPGPAVPGLPVPADAPPTHPQPYPQPYQDPAPVAAIGLAGCGGPGADQGSPKGASAPAAAGVLGSPFEISLAVNDAARTAPATGSTATTADDPGSRPD
jgi:hypothetical protein